MIHWLLSLFGLAADPRCCGAARSDKWPLVRDAWLKEHPTCAVCGTRNGVEAHHIQPFHEHPALELDPTNLITLGRDCQHHITFGHLGDYKSHNPRCVADATLWNAKYASRP